MSPADEVVLRFANLPTEGMPEPSAPPATVPPVLTWSVLGVIALGVFLALVYPFLESSREER